MTEPSTHRPDIQGLRALAVLLVVANHLGGHPTGGFVGVDVFFVISGYLITGHLVRQQDRDGRLALVDFYKRRIRRLLPAALAVTLLTASAARVALIRPRAAAADHDAVWATVFVANWHFIRQGTDYFSQGLGVSPLQHYWSLSVEEQFYVAWPLLLLVALAFGARRRVRVVVTVVVAAGSFTVALLQSTSNPTAAYFSTATRAWELALGALLVLLVPRATLHRQAATVVSGLGVAAISLSALITSTAHFPAPGALLPCVGAVAVLGAGATDNRLLSNRVSRYVGDISYSVYLIHFPVVVLLAALMPDGGTRYYLTALALTAAASIALFHGLEDPIRRSRWLAPRSEGLPPPAARARLAPAVAVVVLLAAAVALPRLNPVRHTLPSPSAGTARAEQLGLFKDQPQLQALNARITAATGATAWPALRPSLDEVIGGPIAVESVQRCSLVSVRPSESCTFGTPGARHSMYLVGDSTAMVDAQALIAIVEGLPDWKLRIGIATGCHFDRLLIASPDKGIQRGCTAHNDAVVRDINAVRPDLLVATDFYGEISAAEDGSPVDAGRWAVELAAQLEKVRGAVARTVIVAPAVADKNVGQCFNPRSHPVDCLSSITPVWDAFSRAEAGLAGPTTTYVDSRYWFCSATGNCPAFVDTAPVKLDADHATAAYEHVLVPVIREAFQRNGLLPVR